MPKGNYKDTTVSRIRLEGVVRDGKLVGVIDESGEETGIALVEKNKVTGGGRYLINGDIVSGEWVTTPAIFKLLMNGSGTVTLDARDANGVVTTGVFSQTLSNAVNEVGFPYAGDAAMAVRANFPTTATVQVI